MQDELFTEFLKGSDLTDLLLGDPEIDSEEFLQYFLSIVKTLALRAKPAAMHRLSTANDFPLMRRAMQLSAHGDQMVRTQARAAYLTILRGLPDDQVREKAIELAQEMLPQMLRKLLWSQWSSMAEAANRQNALSFRAAAWDEDTFEHFTELILLQIPEITELVAGTVTGTFLARFGCLVSSPVESNNVLNAQFMGSDTTSFIIVPSPKSGEVSISESTMESEGPYDATSIPNLQDLQLQCAICEDAKSSLENCPFNASLAWRTLASFAKTFGDANLGGVVLPLVELVTLPFIPSWLLTSIRQLQSGQCPKELAKFSEQLAAAAMEDMALSAWSRDVTKLRHEHWRCQLRSAPGLLPRGEACEMNPFRQLLLSSLGTDGCGLDAMSTSFISFSPNIEMSSLQCIGTNTAACILIAELQALYPPLLEDVEMIERPAIEVQEEPPENNPGMLGSFTEAISWLMTAAGLGQGQCSLISSL